ncbi:PEGA domain-containing protein [Butyrivibrio proteoclasticus B316]|uniref:PEGA domain-containing protein n=1 Tax=Butyrivibrio proteoclasticus (strain ATCC 51982 / DSM 14932 / B316) TaxID=515622 RepID=E0RVV8_BUTPB|nr:PEGA domain-containing protein [Butyrivibrio proteoclasticus B316]
MRGKIVKKTNPSLKVLLSLLLVGILAVLSPVTCVASDGNSGKINISLLGRYDSADVAAIRAVDVDNKEIRFRNHSTGKTYTLSYDNTSMMFDIYGRALSPRLLEVGQIVEVTFLKSTKHITTLDVSREAWTIASTRDHDLVRNDGTAVVKGDVYKIDPRTLIIAEDQLALAEDILSTDTVTVSGIGKDIYSVVVQSGHGYVSLSSETVENQSLVGAWLELDNEVIHKISPNMLLSAPEGDYNLQILGNGANYQSEVSINRNQETVIDTSNVTISRPKEGLVTFDIDPDTADVFVDGTRMLTGVPQTIQYGYHNLKIIADGYVTQTKYLKVGTPKSVISITLEKEESAEEASSATASISLPHKESSDASSKASTKEKDKNKSSSASSSASRVISSNSSGKSTVDTGNKVIEGYRIYIDEPNGAELYFDGNYIGLIPCSIAKISGNHEIIIKKAGYETKSYRINIDRQETNLKYEFPPMIKIKDDKAAEDNSSDSASKASTQAPSESSTESSSAPSEASSEDSTGASTESSSQGASDQDGTSKDSGDSSGGASSDDHGSDSSSEVSDAASTASASSGD